MTLPKISIVTPSFNQARFLEQTIRSVLDQRYPNLEYIVIDGGSADGSVEIIRKYERQLAFWVSESDGGQANAINKGLTRASGDILAYLNSDDLYLPGALWRVVEAQRRNPEVDLIHGKCLVVDVRGEAIGQRFGSITRYDEILDLWDVWWSGRNFVQPEVFWTRRISDKVGPFREDLNWVMDYEYWLRILRARAKVATVDDELAAFRLHPSQKSTQAERVAEELLKVVRPFIWEKSASVSRTRRLALKGKWIFDAMFRDTAQRSRTDGESRARRWARLGRLSLAHPEVVMTREFRERAVNVVAPGKHRSVAGGAGA